MRKEDFSIGDVVEFDYFSMRDKQLHTGRGIVSVIFPDGKMYLDNDVFSLEKFRPEELRKVKHGSK